MPSGDIPVLSEVFGSTPDIIHWEDIGLGAEQLKSIEANLAAFPKIEELGGKYYDYMLGLMDRSIPGFADILSQGGELTKKMQGIASEELGGQIPQDVIDQVTRSTAYQNLGAGTFGGPMGTANQARNLGLTSLDMIQKGIGTQEAAVNATQRWAQIASGLNMNPASFFISPEQQFNASVMNQTQRNAALQREENLKAAPSPVAKGISDTIINLVGAYLGAGRGGGGGGTASQYEFGGAGAPASDVTTPGYYVNNQGGGGAPPNYNMGVSQPFGQPSNYNPYVSNPMGDISGYGYGNVFNATTGYQDYPPMGIFNNPPPNELMYPTRI